MGDFVVACVCVYGLWDAWGMHVTFLVSISTFPTWTTAWCFDGLIPNVELINIGLIVASGNDLYVYLYCEG
jgi:hypothetical protein